MTFISLHCNMKLSSVIIPILICLFYIEIVVSERQCTKRVYRWCGLKGECHLSQCLNDNKKEPSKLTEPHLCLFIVVPASSFYLKVQQREIQKKILQECSLCNDRSHRWTMLFFDGLRNVKLKPKAKACEAQSLFLFEHQIIA